MGAFCIKDGYVERSEPEYFVDSLPVTQNIIHQPDVYRFAAYLAERFGCGHILDIGCGQAHKLVELHPSLKIVGVDFGPNIEYCRKQYPFGSWVECDLESESELALPEEIVGDSIIVCSDVIEHLKNPDRLLALLRKLLERAPAAVLTTPERDLVRGVDDFGPPANPCHVREWARSELSRLMTRSGLNVEHLGLTFNNNVNLEKKTIAAVLGRSGAPRDPRPPSAFKVVAIMTAYNEEDIILPSIKRLNEQGVQVYLIDNWSTDATVSSVQHLVGNGIIGIERFPAEGPPTHYLWKELLERVEQLASSRGIDADWFIHHDVDEIRETPWEGVILREGLFRVDQAGFNCVDHTCVVFHPVNDGFAAGGDFKEYFTRFEFGARPGHFKQVKAWKNLHRSVALSASGGHEVQFEGRRIYPYKFLLRHYPIRSQMHGRKKILEDRHPRWSPAERSAGWHTHYDHVDAGFNFLRSESSLGSFDERECPAKYLFERLSGVGIVRG